MANEKRLIDANVVLAKQFTSGLSDASGNYYGHADVVFVNDIENAPTVDAVEVVHGRWLDVKETELYVPDKKYTVTHTAETCSNCKVRIGFIGGKQYLYDNQCPSCGATMDLE